jgi:hypothetical protein
MTDAERRERLRIKVLCGFATEAEARELAELDRARERRRTMAASGEIVTLDTRARA